MSDDTSSKATQNTSSSKTTHKHFKAVQWRPEHETILVEWADKAICYRWMHTKANDKFTYKNTWFTIPVIVISTLTGTANFALDRFNEEQRGIITAIVGGFNLFAGILTTIQQFLKISELNEAHRVSVISWDKFHRNIKVELAKHPSERIAAGQMLKVCKEEFDRLMETCPNIPEEIAIRFHNEFSGKPGYEEIRKPDICGELITTDAYRYEGGDTSEDEGGIGPSPENIIAMRQEQEAIERVEKFREEFVGLKSREPFVEEVLDNLGDGLVLPRDRIEAMLERHLEANRKHSLEIRVDTKPGEDASADTG